MAFSVMVWQQTCINVYRFWVSLVDNLHMLDVHVHQFCSYLTLVHCHNECTCLEKILMSSTRSQPGLNNLRSYGWILWLSQTPQLHLSSGLAVDCHMYTGPFPVCWTNLCTKHSYWEVGLNTIPWDWHWWPFTVINGLSFSNVCFPHKWTNGN